MSESLVCIVPPAGEPVGLDELKAFLELPSDDQTRNVKLTSFLLAARMYCEKYTRTKFVTQTWLLRCDAFPGSSIRYDKNGFPELSLPFPPFQSVQDFKYVDVAGSIQTLARDTTYGNVPSSTIYGYQLQPGGGPCIPARLFPLWAKPWPPERLVPAGMMVWFRCGYGGPVTVSIANGSALLTSPGFVFNPDDAPQLLGDTGTAITIPGAGPLVAGTASDLVTTVASVDVSGAATLAANASAAVNSVQAWLGAPVPEPLRLAIMFLAQFYFEQGAIVDQAQPRVVKNLLDNYRNLVS